MTREEAADTVGAFLAALGVREGPVFAGRDALGAMVGAAELYFEYLPGEGALKTSALVYRFRGAPDRRVLEAFAREERGGATPTGGGELEYRDEVRGLFLARTYAETVPAEDFASDARQLAGASLVWGREVAARVASQVFHPEEVREEGGAREP